ncbi:MAG TPA: AEC family transporter [Chloroflexota bacterium]
MTDLVGLAGTLIDVVLPVFLIAALGFIGRRNLHIDPASLTRVSLYILVPGLLFNTLTTTQMGGEEIVRIGLFVTILTGALLALAFVLSRVLRSSRAQTSGLMLAITFSNAANYGLPVNLFAFGQEGFDRAVVFAAFQMVLTFTIALPIAAGGSQPWRQAVGSALRVPVLWAAAAALLLRAFGVPLPAAVGRAAGLLAAGAIPAVILLLGMHIAGMELRRISLATWAGCASRLLLSPFLGIGLARLLGASALTSKVLILEAAMPTAVNATLIASEFDTEPQLVSAIALLTTAISLVTVTGWVAYLRAS